MSGYVTPVTDRDQADIDALNSKAYFNVADWSRIYNNSYLVSSLAAVILDEAISFTFLTTPTITEFPNLLEFNAFVANIEAVRLAVAAENIDGTDTEIVDDYAGGYSNPSPNYVDANLWESTLDAIWAFYDGPDILECPTLIANLTITTGNRGIYIDCLNMADFNADLQGTARLIVI